MRVISLGMGAFEMSHIYVRKSVCGSAVRKTRLLPRFTGFGLPDL